MLAEYISSTTNFVTTACALKLKSTFTVPGSPRNLQSVIEDAECNSELRNVTITWEVSVLSFQ